MTHPYNHPDYARTLAPEDRVVLSRSLGVPLRLRAIPGTDRHDACATYPVAPDLGLPPRADLRDELRSLGAISLVLVTDPLSPHTAETLAHSFEIARPYKTHHVVDRTLGAPEYSAHHRAEVRRGLRRCVAREIALADHLADFQRLYHVLIERHGLGAGHRFGPAYFAHLAARADAFPTFGAFIGDRLVSAHVWARGPQGLHSHLAATDPEGYRQSAAYAVIDASLRGSAHIPRISLGGAPDGGSGAGLEAFKRGFANTTRHTHLCGIIADAAAYDRLSAPARGTGPGPGFFPLYRSLPAHRLPE